jgi:hypothetical protein
MKGFFISFSLWIFVFSLTLLGFEWLIKPIPFIYHSGFFAFVKITLIVSLLFLVIITKGAALKAFMSKIFRK